MLFIEAKEFTFFTPGNITNPHYHGLITFVITVWKPQTCNQKLKDNFDNLLSLRQETTFKTAEFLQFITTTHIK